MAKVILVCGRICCGKTTYAQQLRIREKAVVLSCDEIMLSLLDEQLGERHEVYARRTEAYLLRKALEIVQTGITVILDWGPWTRKGRDEIRAFFSANGAECQTHVIRLDESEWRRRIAGRNTAIDRGEYQAYHVDEGLEAKFRACYEEPVADETDLWIDA